ncbi:ATP-binding cassette domain-containing protein [Ectothiorhodospira variabilis]|nr:ATP-binding cassette domain-containing protein [Ectothiorhodospira variabilis]MCG5495750.1 ATP-binding cassette domain-containing protein [Ectothiorhodospira variabilis]MCG5498686.1 ATP-binding cassette domain-containing protein [Ectothiorhodospira variabilis]MCG5503234.1 ATP-binding cassette domain-containing protein [Ectothiorhodospira variabilis]MCG5506007.1 ATP-binding cassette domain-containing protein [Ectothiorhodospira variabilis]
MNEPNKTASQRATGTISEEHLNLWRIILLLERLQQDMDQQGTEPDEVLINAILDYFEHYSERVQSRPNEILLFERLRARAGGGFEELDELEADYLTAHDALQHLRVLLHRCVEHWPEGRDELCAALDRFSHTLRRHILLEEQILIPQALKVLNEADWTAIAEARDQYNDPLFGERVREEFRDLRHRIINLAPEHVGGLGISHPTRLEAPPDRHEMLAIQGLVSSYGRIQVLHEVDLTIRRGEIVSLVGANGAGKSTLLMTLSGLQPVDAGRMTYEGEDLRRWPSHRRVAQGIVQVPEGRQVFRDMTVHDNLLMGAYTRGHGKEVDQDLERVYGRFPILRQKQRQLAGTLSGGQQQMLVIGRALMARPRLLLLDEPSMGLAPLVVEEIFDIIRELNQEGITIFLVEQNAAQALSVSHRGYVLEAGKVVLEGRGEELLENEQVRAAYLGI